MHHELLYDIGREHMGDAWLGALTGALLVWVLVCCLCRRRMGQTRIGDISVPIADLGATAGASFGFLAAVAFFNAYAEYRSLCATLRDGRAQLVEGPVETFTETGTAYHHRAQLVVSGTTFWIHEAQANGYAGLPSRGSPLREGLPVRIHHVGPKIVRLEVGSL